MLTNYHISLVKKYFFILILLIFAVFIGGNLINKMLRKPIEISEKDYILKSDYPVFHNADAYLNILKKYPYDMGVNISFVKVTRGQSYWDIARNKGISIDTLIGANPFLDSLMAGDDIEIVVPHEDGVLLPFLSIFHLDKMNKLLKGKPSGDYYPSIFDLFSMDDIKFVFYKKRKPLIVNNNIEGLYNIRKNYQIPVKGRFSSLYGKRMDPFVKNKPDFHQGIDIAQRNRTPFKPVREGIVSFVGWKTGYGKCMRIIHKDGYISFYAHCSELLVKEGEFVGRDTIVGKVGSTGRSTGPHLHLEIKKHGKNLNPLYFIW